MKKIIFIFAFLVVLPMVAQKNEATLYFRDGTVVKGLAEIVHKEFFKKIKFRKKKGAKKIFYTSEEVESIEITKKKNSKIITQMYCYIETAEHGRVLLEQIEKGKVTLFTMLETSYGQGSRIDYYVSKDNGNTVFLLSSKGNLYSKKSKIFNFKKNASKYFKDCPELVAKIQSKEYKKKHIVEIVKFYNENCDLTNKRLNIN